ncbi:DUF6498-containing protein [Natrarchaeobaculum aegyptiacum]|uniref:Uncharacterized protein n=1 Tax=Natrarchaeobaculum aegyptiacum TaxID=745377 RepID=A0A2Z2HZR9_9EURY|nr:DUF6498-containing protein [Natrarchaeobaculum aegyptiacum]ARS90634.1 hypothetical protein B1756_13465 [Natrarchaeobaculum aegyptiacum]
MSKRVDETISDELGVSREYLSPIITHLFLVIGILFFNWEVGEIVLLYLIEIAVIHVLFVTVALFAAQPIEGHDGDKWQREPTPIRLIPFFPPVYDRNVGIFLKYMPFGFVYILPFMHAVVQLTNQSIPSLISPTVGLAILAICITQISRVWQQFLADQAYQNRSPAEAIKVGLWPIHELLVIVLFVFVPVTFVLVTAAFAVDGIESQTIVLLAYVIPIGVARGWLQNGGLTVTLPYER